MSTRSVDIELSIGVEERYRVVACRVTEGISRLTRADVEVSSLEDIDWDSALTTDAVLTIAFDGVPLRKWTLKLGQGGFIAVRDGTLRYAVTLHAPLWLLGHTKNTRKFRNMSAREIIAQVLSEGGVPFAWRATRVTPTRKYCVQYRESNLAFVLRLLEFEGIYYTLDPEGVLVLEDRSSAADAVEGPTSRFELLDAAGALERDELGIHAIRKRASVGSGKATVSDYTWKRPKLELRETAAADIDAELETYDYPVGFRNPKDGAYLAQIRLEAQRVPAKRLEGSATVPTFAPARRFTFGDNAGAMFAGDYLLIEVEHLAHNPVYADVVTLPKGRVYENTFRAIPLSVPFRPAWETPRPTIEGTHTVMVRGPVGEEIHTDKYGRFRAQFHWDREATGTDADSRWVRLLQETATSMALARVGWEMSVGYIDGDPDRPVGLARNINGVMVPAYAQPANKNVMTIKTPTYPGGGGFNEIRLDDSAGKMSFYVRAERDLVGIVKHDKSERIGNTETHVVDVHLGRAVENDQSFTVGANSLTTVGNDYRLLVKGNRDKSVGGDESVEVTGAYNIAVVGDETETVGGLRLTEAGLASPSPINRRTEHDMSRAVGGSFIAAGTGNVSTLVKRDYTEMVGGSKVTVAQKGSITETVGKLLSVSVAGSVVRKSGDDMGIAGKNLSVSVGGGARFSSGKHIELRGDVIVVEAQSSLKLAVPDLSIELTPGKAAVKGMLRLDAADQVNVTGAPDNVTK
jgi:type VI secretion system secreted protein VgrG